MKNCLILVLILTFFFPMNSQVWLSNDVQIRFFSETPMENIDAKSNKATIALNSQSGKVFIKVAIQSFLFDKKLMQEHFNENYLESDKYPVSEFQGQIVNMPNIEMDGTYEIKIKGNLSMHGVKKEMEIPATLVVSKGKLEGKSKFKIKCEDFKIEIPKLVMKNIAEEIEVTVSAEIKPFKK